MKTFQQLTFWLVCCFAIGFSQSTFAQAPLTAARVSQLKTSNAGFILGKGTMSTADKTSLRTLLADVNPNHYFVRFSDGSTMGRKNFGLAEVRAVSRVRRPGEAQGMTFITKSPDYVFIYTTDFQAFQSRVGQAKVQQIQQIMQKYQ